MSLEEFHSDSESETSEETVDSSELPEWQEAGEHRFVGEGTVNEAPNKEVNEKQVIDINIIEDDDVVEEAAEMWTPESKESMVEVIQLVFNDGSNWHWPLRDWDNDPAHTRQHFVEQYVPEVIRWQARQNGEDPDKAVRESRFHNENTEPEWVERVTDTGLSEESRKWFNENAEYLPDQLKEVSSSADKVDLDTDDSDWTEDW